MIKMKTIKLIEIIAQVIGMWSVFFVGWKLITIPALEPNLWIRYGEIGICILAIGFLVNKLIGEISEYA